MLSTCRRNYSFGFVCHRSWETWISKLLPGSGQDWLP